MAALTNQAGGVVERYRYSTFGERTVLTADGITTRAASSYNQQIGFTGRYLDKETGLWYFRARYFSGTLGRFIGRDPYKSRKAMGGYQDGFSLYSAYYVPNGVDPMGTVCCKPVGGGKTYNYSGNGGNCPSDASKVSDSCCGGGGDSTPPPPPAEKDCPGGTWTIEGASANGGGGAILLGYASWTVWGKARCDSKPALTVNFEAWGLYQGIGLGGHLNLNKTIGGTATGAENIEDLWGDGPTGYAVVQAGAIIVLDWMSWNWALPKAKWDLGDWGFGGGGAGLMAGAYGGTGYVKQNN